MASDFRTIADSLQSRPTRLQELVPDDPEFLGASDACIGGMGGLWSFSRLAPSKPPPIQAALVTSAERPQGSISTSDLEAAAMIAHKDVLAQHHQVAELTI
jgi:hypothetical protein